MTSAPLRPRAPGSAGQPLARASRRLPCLCLLLALPSLPAALHAAPLPLLELARTVECGDDDDAAHALAELAAAPHPLGVPDAYLSGHAPVLVAAVDILLDALDHARRRPLLRAAIEALVHTWDYCDLGTADAPRDLAQDGDGLLRRWPATPPPLAGRGFRAWGLWPGERRPPDEEERCEAPVSVFDFQPSVPAGPLAAVLAEGPSLVCHPPPVLPPLPEWPPLPRPRLWAPKWFEPTALRFVTVPPARAGALVSRAPPPGPRLGLSGSFGYTGQLSGSHSVHANISWSPIKNLSFKVGLSYQYRASENWQASIDDLSWAWGIEYEDSRPGTLSVQLNNWGPIRFKANLDFLKKAVLDVRYKVPFPKGVAKYIGLSVGWNQPLQAAPGVALTLSVRPLPHITAFVGYRIAPFNATHVTWSYGIGYDGDAPFRLSVSINNWGPNKLTEFALLKRGEVDVSLGWSF
ncbi:MAG TPA: hypothetical protein VH877_24695 [Polyangia bacterium]|nr:hypothetical protein [Polyangia bacterium]